MSIKEETITTMVCKVCGESASGPDAKEVAATMARHRTKKHSLWQKRK